MSKDTAGEHKLRMLFKAFGESPGELLDQPNIDHAFQIYFEATGQEEYSAEVPEKLRSNIKNLMKASFYAGILVAGYVREQ